MDSADVADVMAQAGPYLAAALSAYGAGVLTRAEHAAVNSTAQVGHRLLLSVEHGLRGRRRRAFRQLAENPGAADGRGGAGAALHEEIRSLLRSSDAIAAEFRSILAGAASRGGLSGERSMTVNGPAVIAATGDIGSLTIHGDPRAASTPGN